MADLSRPSRRSLILGGLGAILRAEPRKGAAFPSDLRRYADPATDLPVIRLTDPACSSALPAHYNRSISHNSAWMLLCSDRDGSPQAFRMELQSGEMRQLTDADALDGASLSLLPDDRSFCYFDGRAIRVTALAGLKEREIYAVPDDWERCRGMSVNANAAWFAERQGERSRLRMAPLGRGAARTVAEAPFAIEDPVARPQRAQAMYRDAGRALWLVNADGRQNRRIPTPPGRIGPAGWTTSGRTILYLHFPEDAKQLNAIREYSPEEDKDTLVARTSQFAHFGFNRNDSVFVGASRNAASPCVILLLRRGGRELTICEHHASQPGTVAPMFSPDAQCVYFQSDRHGKPAIYCMHVERLVEKIEEDTP